MLNPSTIKMLSARQTDALLAVEFGCRGVGLGVFRLRNVFAGAFGRVKPEARRRFSTYGSPFGVESMQHTSNTYTVYRTVPIAAPIAFGSTTLGRQSPGC